MAVGLADLVPFRPQVRLFEFETANMPRTTLIAEVLTLTLDASRSVEPSVAHPWRTSWSVWGIVLYDT